MLKSTFKKVSAIAIAGTMLAGMMAVPANAWTSTQVSKTETAISEDFSSFSSDAVQVMDETPTPFAGNQYITVNKYSAYGNGNYPSGFKASIGENNSLKLMGKQGAQAVLYNKSDSTSVQRGDVITVTFKYKYDAYAGRMRVNLNDSSTSRSNYVYIESNGTNNDAASYASDAGGARILSISMYDGRIQESNTVWNGPNISKDAWNEITITIDTANDDFNGNQTIKVQKGSNYFIGYYDADYKGEDDDTYDLINNISSITFATNGPLYGVSGVEAEDGTPNEGTPNCWIDDISVKVTGDRPEYVSDLSNVVLNETFDNLVETSGASEEKDVTGTSFKVKSKWGNQYKISPSTVNGNPVATITAAYTSAMKADLGNVEIGANDEIHVSYDRQSQPSWRSGINCGYSADSSDVGTLITSLDGTTGTGAIEANINGKLRIGGIDDSNCWITNGAQLHVEYVIKVSDPEHGNKQTVTYTVTGPENSMSNSEGKFSSWSRTYYIDADNITPGEQKFTSLENFGAYLESSFTYNEDAKYTLDNVKVEVVKPGFEVADDHTASGNTYTFSGNDAITLNYVVDASAASKVIIAQYDNTGRLISATPQAVAATGTVTVTPNPNAKKIKVMVLDMSNALPYTKAFVMTRQ